VVIKYYRELKVIICLNTSFQELTRFVENCLHEIRNNFKQFGILATSGVGMYEESLETLDKAFHTAKISLDKKFVMGKDIDIFFDRIAQSELTCETMDLHHEQFIKKLVQDIKYGNLDSLHKVLNAIENTIKRSRNPLNSAQVIITDIFYAIYNILNDLNLPADNLSRNPIKESLFIMNLETVDDISLHIKQYLIEIVHLINSGKQGKYHNLKVKTKEYVGKNYTRTSLSLCEVAEHCCLSQNYFTMIFKEVYDKTFIEYLTEIRIDKAKELLFLSDLKIYEISLRVGYENPSYFSTIFKKTTGFTPNDFRNNIKKNGN
jgi:two-component system, response regulator YesN